MMQTDQPFWDRNSSSAACTLCKKSFNLVSRRHHCRYCGKLVCHTCSSNKVNLVASSDTNNGKNTAGVRVCDPCFLILTVKEENKQKAEQILLQQQELLSFSSYLSSTLCNVYFLDGSNKTICYDEFTTVHDVVKDLFPYFPLALFICTQDLNNPNHYLLTKLQDNLSAIMISFRETYPYAKLVLPIYKKAHLKIIMQNYCPVPGGELQSLQFAAFSLSSAESQIPSHAHVAGADIDKMEKKENDREVSPLLQVDAQLLKIELESTKIELAKAERRLSTYKELLQSVSSASQSSILIEDDNVAVTTDESNPVLPLSSSQQPLPQRRRSSIMSSFMRTSSFSKPNRAVVHSETISIPTSPLIQPTLATLPVKSPSQDMQDKPAQWDSTNSMHRLQSLLSLDSSMSLVPDIQRQSSSLLFIFNEAEEQFLTNPLLLFPETPSKDQSNNETTGLDDANIGKQGEKNDDRGKKHEEETFVRSFFYHISCMEQWLVKYQQFFQFILSNSSTMLSQRQAPPPSPLLDTKRLSKSILHLFHMLRGLDRVYLNCMDSVEVFRGKTRFWLKNLLADLLTLPVCETDRVKITCQLYFSLLQNEQEVQENLQEFVLQMIDSSLLSNITCYTSDYSDEYHQVSTEDRAFMCNVSHSQHKAQNSSNNAQLKSLTTLIQQLTSSSSSPSYHSLSSLPFSTFQRLLENIFTTYLHLLSDDLKAVFSHVSVLSLFTQQITKLYNLVIKVYYKKNIKHFSLSEKMMYFQFLDKFCALCQECEDLASNSLRTELKVKLQHYKEDLSKQITSTVVSEVNEKMNQYRHSHNTPVYEFVNLANSVGEDEDDENNDSDKRDINDTSSRNLLNESSIMKVFSQVLNELEDSSGSVLESYSSPSSIAVESTINKNSNPSSNLPASIFFFLSTYPDLLLLQNFPMDLFEHISKLLRDILYVPSPILSSDLPTYRFNSSANNKSLINQSASKMEVKDFRISLFILYLQTLSQELSKVITEQWQNIAIIADTELALIRTTTLFNNLLLSLSYVHKLSSYLSTHLLMHLQQQHVIAEDIAQEFSEKYFLVTEAILDGVIQGVETFTKIIVLEMKRILEKLFFNENRWEESVEGMIRTKKLLKSRLLFLKHLLISPDFTPSPLYEKIMKYMQELYFALFMKYNLPLPAPSSALSSFPSLSYSILFLCTMVSSEEIVRGYIHYLLVAYGNGLIPQNSNNTSPLRNITPPKHRSASFLSTSGTEPSTFPILVDTKGEEKIVTDSKRGEEGRVRRTSANNGESLLGNNDDLRLSQDFIRIRHRRKQKAVHLISFGAGLWGLKGEQGGVASGKSFKIISMNVINRLNEDLQLLVSLCEDLRFLILVVSPPSNVFNSSHQPADHYDQVHRISLRTKRFFRRPLRKIDKENGKSEKGKRNSGENGDVTSSLVDSGTFNYTLSGYASKQLLDRILEPLQHFVYACQMNKQYLNSFVREHLIIDFGYQSACKIYSFLLFWRGESPESIKSDFSLHFKQLMQMNEEDKNNIGKVIINVIHSIKSANIIKP